MQGCGQRRASLRIGWRVRDGERGSCNPVARRGRRDLRTESAASPAAPTRLMDRLRGTIRARHLSVRTERAYAAWVRRFIHFHGRRHPDGLGEAAVEAYLHALARDRGVSASTQNQALSALLFLYRDVLARRHRVDGRHRACETAATPAGGADPRGGRRAARRDAPACEHLVASLLYGAGLRLLECCRLRVKDVEISRGETRGARRQGWQGSRDAAPRATPSALAAQLERVRGQHAQRSPPRRRQRRAAARARRASTRSRRSRSAGNGYFPATRFHVDPRERAPPPSPLARDRAAAGRAPGRGAARHRAAGQLPFAPALVRHASTGSGLRHPNDPGAARASRRVDHDDLHARAEPRRPGRAQPTGRVVVVLPFFRYEDRLRVGSADLCNTTDPAI